MLSIEQCSRAVRWSTRRSTRSTSSSVPAETIAVLGPSGSGKTTLLRAVAGLQPLDGGRIAWDGAGPRRRCGARTAVRAHVPGVRAVPAPRRRRQRRVRPAHGDARHGIFRSGGAFAAGRRGARSRRVDGLADPSGRLAVGRGAAASRAGARRWPSRLGCSCSTNRSARSTGCGAGGCSPRSVRSSIGRALAALYVTHDHEEAFAIA